MGQRAKPCPDLLVLAGAVRERRVLRARLGELNDYIGPASEGLTDDERGQVNEMSMWPVPSVPVVPETGTDRP